jgi:nickel superoxide dismutase
MQAASKCKQGIARQDGLVLVEQLNRFSEMFWQSKDMVTHRVIAPYPPALEVVHPYLKDA